MSSFHLLNSVGRRASLLAPLFAVASLLSGCESMVDNRIPAVPVSINLGDAGLWNSFGVAGFGISRQFIKSQQPADFPWNASSYTGFGGVLLIGGMDPYTGNTNVPLAYDLACPYEVKSNIRVSIRESDYMAVCPVCGSVYDVTMAGGAPVSGPAAAKNNRYKMQSYQVLATQYGGYMITR